VPPALRLKILDICYDAPLAGHYGRQRTQKLVERNYYWPGLAAYVKEYIQGCHSCSRNKHSTHKAYGLLESHPNPERPWSRVGIDFITGLPTTSEGYDCIMVMIDAYTKMAHFEPTSFKGLTAKKTARVIRQRCVRYHGVPSTWITDRGSQFVNKFTKTLYTRLGINHFPTTAYHSQGDGQTERVNAPLEAYLRHYINYTQDD
jgi:hypothetical protein